MQQTDKYKLNLIEPSDPFLPQGLNENTQRVEDTLIAHEAKVDGQVADLDARVTVFEAKHFAFGSYTTNVLYNFSCDLGFHPKLVLIATAGTGTPRLIMSSDAENGQHNDLTLTDTGFLVKSGFCGGSYSFLAFG